MLPFNATPATRILPSGCATTWLPTSEPPKSVITIPSPEKLESKLPLALYRANAKLVPLLPPTRIFPSSCVVTLKPISSPPKSVVTIPSPEKLESKLPLAL